MSTSPGGSEYTKAHLALILDVIDRLASVPAEVTASDYRYEAFGCWSVVVKRNGLRYRVDFDGRDRVLLIYRIPKAGHEHSEPSRLIAEHSLPTGLTAETLDRVVAATVTATASERS